MCCISRLRGNWLVGSYDAAFRDVMYIKIKRYDPIKLKVLIYSWKHVLHFKMAWKLAGWILWGRISRRYEDWKYTSWNFAPKSSLRRKNRKFTQFTRFKPFPTVVLIIFFVNIVIALLALWFKTLWNPKSFANSTTKSQLRSEALEIFKKLLYEYFRPWGRIKQKLLETRKCPTKPNGTSEPALSWSSPYSSFDGCWSKIPTLAEIFWRAPNSTSLLQQG